MKNKRIVFLGTHGQMNIGDELLLETFVSKLGPENEYFVNSYDPAFTAAQLDGHVRAEVFNTATERGKLLRYLWQSDLLFFGGGSIIKELYATIGRNPYSVLLMVLAIVTFTRQIARKPIVMSNIGVGPLMTPRGKQLAGMILRQVDVLSVRDRKSYKTCMELGLSPERVQLVPDAVFSNPPSVFLPSGGPAASPRTPRNGPLKIALNLNFDIENPDNWETFQRILAQALHTLADQSPLEIHTLPMQSHFKAMHDALVLEEFRTRVPDLDVIIHSVENHREASEIIAHCDLLLAERLHAIVMAAILGKPFFALMYDVKVRELVEWLEMGAYSVDINRPFDPLVLVSGIDSVTADAEQISCHLVQRSTALRNELDAYFVSLEERLPWAKAN